MFEREIKEIAALLRPKSRRQIEANAKLRSLAIIEGAFQGEKLQPGERELRKLAIEIRNGRPWQDLFPGVASLDITTKGYGPSIDLRITKKDGIPVTLVPEGTPGASVVAIKRVDETGFYNLNHVKLAEKLGLTQPKLTAVIKYCDLKADPECFKEFVFFKDQAPDVLAEGN